MLRSHGCAEFVTIKAVFVYEGGNVLESLVGDGVCNGGVWGLVRTHSQSSPLSRTKLVIAQMAWKHPSNPKLVLFIMGTILGGS